MTEIVINTEQNSIRLKTTQSQDPFHNLPANEWVQKQIEWRNSSEPSGLYLDKVLLEHFNNEEIVGAEIGVCLAATTELFMKNVSNIIKYYAIDNYPTYVDWNGGDLNEDRQKLIKEYAFEILRPYSEKIEFIYEDSSSFAKRLQDETLDFIFIDGDHSYEGFTRDLKNYYCKVKKGGIISGDDITIPNITKGLNDFFEKNSSQIKTKNKIWYLIKE